MAQTKLSPDSPGRLAPLQRAVKPPAEKPKRAIRNTKLRRLRALRIIEFRAVGWSNSEIAEELRLSTDYVREELVWADKNGLIEVAEQRVLEQMVPKALDVVMKRMETADPLGLDLRAATAVLGILKDLSRNKATKEARREDREFDVAHYLAERAERIAAEQAAGGGSTTVTVERVVAEDPKGLLPAHGAAANAPVDTTFTEGPDSEGPGEDSRVPDAPAGGGADPGRIAEPDSKGLV